MHASSFESMARCYARYLARDGRTDVRLVLDIGGADINGNYRPIFGEDRFRYVTVDASDQEGVDVVLADPYELPFPDASADIVLSGQMLEHCEFFWLAFAEMMRVLKPDGILFLIAPSSGPIHRVPVDCYRFYPDAYRALAKFAGCHLLEVWRDERGPWFDLVGVFAKQPRSVPEGSVTSFDPPTATDLPPGTDAEEATAGEAPYLSILRVAHEVLEPDLYLEVGVGEGSSLALARGSAIGIDPASNVDEAALPSDAQVARLPSDEYFRQLGPDDGVHPDLAFIDGMHRFEYALRDFMNIERIAKPSTLVVINGVFPCHPAQAERERRTRVWTGDVWKLRRILANLRGDLVTIPVDASPTGVMLVAGLRSNSPVLWNLYNHLASQYGKETQPPDEVLSREGALSPLDPRIRRALEALRSSRDDGAAPPEVRARVRDALESG